MRAVIFPQPGAVSYESVDDPTCGDQEVIIKVARAVISAAIIKRITAPIGKASALRAAAALPNM